MQKTMPGLPVKEAKKELKKVQGHIVLQPLDFLKDTLGVTGKYKLPVAGEIPKNANPMDDLLRLCWLIMANDAAVINCWLLASFATSTFVIVGFICLSAINVETCMFALFPVSSTSVCDDLWKSH